MASAVHVTNVINDAGQLVETTPNNYALRSPALAQLNILTATRNGNSAVIINGQCQSQVKNWDALSAQERAAIEAARAQLAASSHGSSVQNSGITVNNMQSSITSSISGSDPASHMQQQQQQQQMHTSSSSFNLNSNGVSISQIDDNNFTISRDNLPSNAVRMLVYRGYVTAVYRDNQVQMKPLACVSQVEQQLVQTLRNEVQQAHQKYTQRMQQFSQNMQQNMNNMRQNMQQNMQQSMQQMQQRMQSMLQPPQMGFNTMANMGGFGQSMGFNMGGMPQAQNVAAAYGAAGPQAYGKLSCLSLCCCSMSFPQNN